MKPTPRLVALVVIVAGVSIPLMVSDALIPLIALLWGTLIAAAGVDLLASTPARNLSAELTMPQVGYTGTTVNAEVRVIPRKGRMPTGIAMRLLHARALEVEPSRPRSEGGGACATMVVRLTRRGRFRIKGLAMKWPSRLGLFEVVGRWPLRREIAALPDVTPVTTGLVRVQMLPLTEGQKDMRLTGGGSEFYPFRDFVPGLDPRQIDGMRPAKTEGAHQILLCLDSGRLMREEIEGLPKIDRAINAALALAWAAGLGGDTVGLYSFDSRPRLYLPPMPGRVAFPRLKAAVADLAYSAVESNPTLAITHLEAKLARRSLIIVFSDFTDSASAELMVENLGLLARRHLILFVALRDPMLQRMALPETITLDSVAEAVSADQIEQDRRLVLARLSRAGVLCLDAEPGRLTSDLVARYVEIRTRELL